MSCGGFTCSKNALTALNILYVCVAVCLIGLGAYASVAALVTSPGIVGGIIACGTFLLLIALFGLAGAMMHNQIILFFYMIVLFLLFLVQFAVACACLAINKPQQKILLSKAWEKVPETTKASVQKKLQCCGFEQSNTVRGKEGHPACGASGSQLSCCKSSPAALCCVGLTNSNSTKFTLKSEILACPCKLNCWNATSRNLDSALKITGAIGLFFSFTEIVGVWLAVRYRNQKNPAADPSAFL